ncbi:MAG: outer membrane protein assembly factor BamD [Treponema sp.]|nr:outer membrane protein assembly factor BamD [Treponema sp.]
MSKRIAVIAFLYVFSLLSVFPQTASRLVNSSVENSNLKQGAEAYKNEDWVSAIFFLRKVVALPGGVNDENYFMLIKSEIYAGEYRQAQADCEKFIDQFPLSPYSEYVRYQNGRLLHLLARNEDSILFLSDFCHQNTDSELFPLAIFWIAEAFYDEYCFDSARGLYERVVNDYPSCEKAPLAQYKLDLIERREREEKLLYLLKVIGEENLSTREEYERQLRVYALEDENGVRRSLLDAQARIAELEALLEDGLVEEGGLIAPSEEVSVVKEKVTEKAASKTEAEVEKTVAADNSKQKKTSSTVTKPKEPVVNIIQSVSESSIRVRQNETGLGTSAAKNNSGSSKDSGVQALKRKAKQLQYLLDEQEKDVGK